MSSEKTIHLFGAAKGIGRAFATNRSFQKFPICAYDLDEDMLRSLPKSITKCHIAENKQVVKYGGDFHSGDWFVLAVPEHAVEGLIGSLAPHLPHKSLVVCLTSVQKPSLETIRAAVDKNASVIGFHPLFGPAVNGMVGQLAVICDYDRTQEQHRLFFSFVKDLGIIPTVTASDIHDDNMLYVQALTHFSLLVFADLLRQQGKSFEELYNYRTPPFISLSSAACRMLSGQPLTYMAIQKAAAAKEIRERFIASALRLNTAIGEARDAVNATGAFEEVVDAFNHAEVIAAKQFNILAHNAIEATENHFFNVKGRGHLFIFRYTTQKSEETISYVKYGRIEGIEQDAIVLAERKAGQVEFDGKMLSPVPLNETAVANYKTIGVNFGHEELILNP